MGSFSPEKIAAWSRRAASVAIWNLLAAGVMGFCWVMALGLGETSPGGDPSPTAQWLGYVFMPLGWSLVATTLIWFVLSRVKRRHEAQARATLAAEMFVPLGMTINTLTEGKLSGKVPPYDVDITRSSKGPTRLTLTGAPVPAGVRLQGVPTRSTEVVESVLRITRDVLETGDVEFDARVQATGDPGTLHALLTPKVRHLARELLRSALDVVHTGTIRASTPRGPFTVLRKPSVQTTRHMLTLAGELERFKAAPETLVIESVETEETRRLQLRALLLLLADFGDRDQTRAAVSRWRGADSADIQAVLAIYDGSLDNLTDQVPAMSSDGVTAAVELARERQVAPRLLGPLLAAATQVRSEAWSPDTKRWLHGQVGGNLSLAAEGQTGQLALSAEAGRLSLGSGPKKPG